MRKVTVYVVLGVVRKIISKCNVNRAITGCNLNSNIEYILEKLTVLVDVNIQMGIGDYIRR